MHITDPSRPSAGERSWRFAPRPSVLFDRSVVAEAAVVAYVAVWVLHVVHAAAHGHGASVWAVGGTVLVDVLLAVPLVLVAIVVVDVAIARYGRRLLPAAASRSSGRMVGMLFRTLVVAAGVGVLLGIGGPVRAVVFAGAVMPGSWLVHGLMETAVAAAAVCGALLLAAAAREAVPLARQLRWRMPSRLMPRVVTVAVVLAMIGPVPVLPQTVPAAAAQAAPAECTAGAAVPDRVYDVAAVNVEIPFNRWAFPRADVDGAQRDRFGMMFVLEQDKEAVVNWHVPLADEAANDVANNRRLRPRPLVLRANEGECVQVTLTNELAAAQWQGRLDNPRVGMQVRGPAYDVQTSDGQAVGFNDDSTVAIGEAITYHWLAPEEGIYLFRDGASLSGQNEDQGSIAHGLYGALVVEPAGSTWRDPTSGAVLSTAPLAYTGVAEQSGDLYIDAIIEPPDGRHFRESVQLVGDYVEFAGNDVHVFNYGTEPIMNRGGDCPDCVGEETSLSSWTYGDPALVKLASGLGPWLPDEQGDNPEDCGLEGSCWVQNVTRAYPNDPFKLRYGLPGGAETHVFHLHAHTWLAEPNDVGASGPTPGQPSPTKMPASRTIDSQTFGPGEAFTADLLFGAGSKPGTVGDSIFHCHLYPHFAAGFWALLRVHDVFENGSTKTPDGINVRNLEPLADRPAADVPPLPIDDENHPDFNPGFPRYIPGKFGWRAPQPPGGAITIGGPNGDPVRRIVAGLDLADEALAVKDPELFARAQAEKLRLPNGGAGAAAGAPLSDPCPDYAREITYNVSVIQMPVVYNEAGWYDTQGRILVLDEDVEAVLAGTKEPEPLFFRVNEGDCINFTLTNLLPNWFGNDAFIQLQQTNMVAQHTHLVKYDVLGSDGSSNGWNYQQAAFTREQHDFNEAILDGEAVCNDVVGGCILPLVDPAAYDPLAGVGSVTDPQTMSGQTIHSRWYADYELETVFQHDHHFAALDQNRGLFAGMIVEPAGMDMRDPVTGEFYQPINDPAHGTPCGNACVGTAAGANMDIVGPGANDDFREFGLAFQDFTSLVRPDGTPIVPPPEPEHLPEEDPGVAAVNYRNAPFKLRETLNGEFVDPAYRLSSHVFGDPMTPILQAYAGDRVKIRALQGSQEHQHVLSVHGMRWKPEPRDPNSPWVNAQPIGISEQFAFRIPEMQCGVGEDCAGDYLWSSTNVDDMYMGVWGIMRVHGAGVKGLLPLPDNPKTGNANPPQKSGAPPPPANKPGTPCPTDAPTRDFHVIALEAAITYNDHGDHDPYGLMYALVEPGETPEQAAERARANPVPLVIRANEGDCLEVQLTNLITEAWLAHGDLGTADGDAFAPGESDTGTQAGLRVSLHPQLVAYDVRGSDGATVGFNRDQTVGPGESIRYRWFVPDVSPGEFGATNLLDYGDVRGHRHHGLFAGLNIQPKGARYHDPYSGAEIRSGEAADIRIPGRDNYREFTVFFQDGLNLRDTLGNHIEMPDEAGAVNDFIDQGEKAFNYKSEPFHHRLGGHVHDMEQVDGHALANVFNSDTAAGGHGDPATPIFRAYAGDPVRVRLLQGSDKQRQHSFQLAGHAWYQQPHDPNSNLVATQGGLSVATHFNLHLPSAGGLGAHVGDWRYSCGLMRHHLSGGLWGIMRTYAPPDGVDRFVPDPLADRDDPRTAGYHPIMPLEGRATVTVETFNDENLNGLWGAGEGPGPAGATVKLWAADADRDVDNPIAQGVTNDFGAVSFDVGSGVYDAELLVPDGWHPTTAVIKRVDVSGEDARARVEFGLVMLARALTVSVFNDADGDTDRGQGEDGLAGWLVRIAGPGGEVRELSTNADGDAVFEGLVPGEWLVDAVIPAGWRVTTPVLPTKVQLAPDGTGEVTIGVALEAGLSVKVFNDANQDVQQGANERSLAGWQVAAEGPLEAGDGAEVYQGTTDANGIAVFTNANGDGLTPGTYRITQTLQPDWQFVSGSSSTIAADGSTDTTGLDCPDGVCETVLLQETTQVVTLGNYNPYGWVSVYAFNDLNADGVRQGGESKLVGWTVELYAAGGTTLVATTTTGNNGIATFYPLEPGTYDVAMVAPEVAEGEPDWTATTPNPITLTVTEGEIAETVFGFARLGTIQAFVWHDLDRDGVYDQMDEGSVFDEPVVANRTVHLREPRGQRRIVATAVTGDDGIAAFKAAVGQEYLLEVTLPDGWVATAPLDDKDRVVTRVTVFGPAGTDSVSIKFGQYDTLDTTPPPDPVATPGPDAYTEPAWVTLTSESGATIRYTTDGSDPTATKGTVYVGPILIGQTTTLKAIAIDPAGNLSKVATYLYTIAGDAELQTTNVAPHDGVVSAGSIFAGGWTSLAEQDLDHLKVRAQPPGNRGRNARHTLDWHTLLDVPEDARNAQKLVVTYVGGASRTGIERSLSLYDFAAGAWATVATGEQTVDDQTITITPAGDPKRFISSGGEVRLRVDARHPDPFDLHTDQYSIRVTY